MDYAELRFKLKENAGNKTHFQESLTEDQKKLIDSFYEDLKENPIPYESFQRRTGLPDELMPFARDYLLDKPDTVKRRVSNFNENTTGLYYARFSKVHRSTNFFRAIAPYMFSMGMAMTIFQGTKCFIENDVLKTELSRYDMSKARIEYVNNDSRPDIVFSDSIVYLQKKDGKLVLADTVRENKADSIKSLYQQKIDSISSELEIKLHDLNTDLD